MEEYCGSNILLFIPGGVNSLYGKAIYNCLVSKGCNVSVYPERPSSKTIDKIVLRLVKRTMPSYFCSYIKHVIQLERKDFDFIFVIRGEGFSPVAVDMLRGAYPMAKLILYTWDVFATNDLSWIVKCFDRTISFDIGDAKKYKMVFRPSFFLPEHLTLSKIEPTKYDLFMAGTISSDRYYWMKRMERYLQNKGMNYFFYYYIPSYPSLIQAKIRGNIPLLCNKKEFHFTPLSIEDQSHYIAQSKCFFDVQHRLQTTSLNRRPFEALATRTKLVTNSNSVCDYNFYRKNNICVVSDDIDIPENFMTSPFEDVPDSIKSLYTVDTWLNDIWRLDLEESYLKFFNSNCKTDEIFH